VTNTNQPEVFSAKKFFFFFFSATPCILAGRIAVTFCLFTALADLQWQFGSMMTSNKDLNALLPDHVDGWAYGHK